jgi:hypothetical protein
MTMGPSGIYFYTQNCNNAIMTKVSIGISFDKDTLEKIDKERGDIARSKYITKVLKKAHFSKNNDEIMRNDLNSLESKTANLHYPSEFSNP